ncbi:MAG: DUF1080 domain-containing protein [Spirochaetes bacterium]|nr:DUF1080 domain-containing protein [Spirochaetota bacterium]
MRKSSIAFLFCLSTALIAQAPKTNAAAKAPANPPPPTGLLAAPGKTLFQDDFSAPRTNDWKFPIPAFVVSNGMLVAWQGRADHGAVSKIAVPFSNAVVQVSFRFEGGTSWNLVFDDRTYKGSHAGHICRVAFTTNGVRLADDKEGAMRNDIFDNRTNASMKAELARRLVGRSLAAAVPLPKGTWHTVLTELVGEEMRVHLDGKPIAALRSQGIAHGKKGDFGFAVSGGQVWFKDLSIRQATPAP